MADKTNITPINPFDFSTELYSISDESLITSLIEENQFDPTTDYVEFIAYDLNNNQVYPGGSNLSFTNYAIIDNDIYVNPEQDLQLGSIDTGTVNVLYNFLRYRLSSTPESTYYISEISSDRTEIRLKSNIISTEEIIKSTNEFISYREQDETFPDFYLNFGSNTLLISNNIVLDTDNTVLIKLYEPLPQDISVKTSLWVVEKISNGLAYRVEFNNIITLPSTNIQIQGPNLNLSLKNELNNPTEEVDLNSFSSPNSQSEYQINSYFNDPSVNINVDYTDFNNFVYFSSAQSRIENFWYKVSLIESASAVIATQSSLTQNPAISSSLTPLNNLINDTITNFDKYEYYLYFESSSDTYPKVNSIPPYENESTGSLVAIDWYNNKLEIAENYDRENQNWLYYAIPEYLRNDSSNDQYFTFVNMLGQFTDDNIWVYLKDTTNKWDADNRINAGVSKDLVAQVLRDMGVKLYQNNFSSTDLYSAFLGFTDSGSLFPFPYMTGSVESAPGILDTPQGYEYITNFISSSDEAIPLDDINKRIYKRIYHNLPYLLKSKGTVAGLRTLITSYGIPDTILRISEFGGKDKINTNDWDLWQHQYNYAINFRDTGHIKTKWHLNSNFRKDPVFNPAPQSLQFRFNAGPYSGSEGIAAASQSLFTTSIGGIPTPAGCGIVLEYDQDLAEIPSSDTYSGSILDPEYQYANLKFTVDNFVTSASIRLPFFNNDWWSVQVSKVDTEYTFYVGNKIYSGSDGSQIGFLESASFVTGNTGAWENNETAHFGSVNGSGLSLSTGNYTNFQGKYQEIRYFRNGLSGSVFNDYVMNPQSTEGNNINSSPNELAFRASLGGELYTGSVSIHPKVSGPTGYPTSSFSSDSDFSISEGEFVENREYIFYDSPPVGIKNRNTDKIKRQDLILPEGDTLSNQISIQQSSFTDDDYTNNLNLLEVAFSPQNEINDDIINQIGFFNIGDYIGDPRLISSSADTYPSLVDLSKEYFEKYTSSYDVYDYIRLIKFFDNSLFKMIKDYVPVRTGLASGIVVKQHILERQKYPTPQAEWTRPEYTGSIGSIPMVDDEYNRYYQASTDFESFPIITTEGGAGGSVNEFNVPVGFLRAVDTGMPSTTINTTPTILFKSGTIVNGIISSNGVAISPKGIIDSTGKFSINSNYTFKGDVNVEVKNSITQRTMVLELVEDINGIINSIQKVVPITTGATYTSLTLTNCVFEAGKTYYFQLKTTTGSTNITGVTRVNFVQQDAPLIFRSGQMYSEVIKTPLGDVIETVSNSHEFYDGEFSGSSVLITDGELNTECDTFKKADTTDIQYYLSSSVPQNTNTFIYTPGPGAAYTMMDTSTNDGLKIYLQWSFDRSERINLSPIRNYYWNVVGFAIKIPESANSIDVEDYITSLNELKLLDVNFVGANATGFAGIGWGGISSKTFTNASNPILIPKSFKVYNAYSNSGRFIYVETEPSEMEFKLNVNELSPSYSEGDLYGFNIASKSLINTVFEPFVPQTFKNSDCNPFYGNAMEDTLSTVYYDVDYANNPNVAVNFDAIMNGTATKAEIQDYNYYARRSTIPRYEGSKNTSNDYNVLDGAIDTTQALFGYFNWVGGTSPEWGNGLEDRSVANLRFLLDVNGKIIKPIADSQGINQSIIESNFTEGKIATLAFDDEVGASAAFSNLLGDHTIFKSGKDITPIIYSQTESISSTSGGGYTSSLNFVQGDQQANASIPDYRLTSNASNPTIVIDGTYVEYDNVSIEGTDADVYNPAPNVWGYKVVNSSPSSNNVTLNLNASLEVNSAVNKQVTVQFYKSTNNGSTFSAVGSSKTKDFNDVTYGGLSISYSTTTANTNDIFALKVLGVTGDPGPFSINNNSQFIATQTPPPNLGAATSYWTKSGNVLTLASGTGGLNNFYGQKQEDIAGTGFFGIVNDFVLQPVDGETGTLGDEIRFEGTETQTYTVTAVSNTNPIEITVDRDITATNIDWFLIRRYVDNPANIILEVDKPAGGTSPGILKPQYLSKDAENNIDTILENLRRDSLI